MEIALFGRIIKNLSYGEALYILNEDNYNKTLVGFREGFMKLSNEDLVVNGQFKESYIANEKKSMI